MYNYFFSSLSPSKLSLTLSTISSTASLIKSVGAVASSSPSIAIFDLNNSYYSFTPIITSYKHVHKNTPDQRIALAAKGIMDLLLLGHFKSSGSNVERIPFFSGQLDLLSLATSGNALGIHRSDHRLNTAGMAQ
jgi:hypothetical protein